MGEGAGGWGLWSRFTAAKREDPSALWVLRATEPKAHGPRIPEVCDVSLARMMALVTKSHGDPECNDNLRWSRPPKNPLVIETEASAFRGNFIALLHLAPPREKVVSKWPKPSGGPGLHPT